MKKYLFLLLLFLFYLILISKKEATSLASYVNDENESVKTITIRFQNGINSKDLINEFSIDKDSYLILNMELENNTYNVNCNKIDECIKNIYEEEDEAFNTKYVASGFKINSLTYLSYDLLNDKFFEDYIKFTNKQ